MNRTLIFDASSSGHHGEFLENLIYGIHTSISNEFCILAHPDLAERLVTAKTTCASKINLTYLSKAQLKTLGNAKSLMARGRFELEIVEGYCFLNKVNRVFLMHMNVHQLALRRCLRNKSMSVRGILLDPYTPLRRAFTLKQKVRAGITGLRKRMQFRIMLLNPQIDTVFLLNDKRLAEDLNRSYSRRQPFASVVDPIPAVASFVESSEVHSRNKSVRYTFLVLGSLAYRKGCLEVLQALSLLNSEEIGRLRVRFVGKFVGEGGKCRQKVFEAIEDLKAQFPALCVEVEDRYIVFYEMEAELQNADCILAPYLGFYGSSGILGHACRHSTPMITCEEGLLGELVRELGVGMTVNPKNYALLADCLKQAVKRELPYNAESAARYTGSADYKNFSDTLFGNWFE